MARQEEEVLITFKTDTSGIDDSTRAMEQQTATVNQANISFGKLFGSIIAGGLVFFKWNTLLRIGNVLFLRNNQVINNLTFNTLGWAKSITNFALPALSKWILGLAALGAAALVVIAATKIMVLGMRTTEEGAKKLTLATTTLTVIWSDFIKFVGKGEEAASIFLSTIVGGLLLMTGQLGLLQGFIQNAAKRAFALNEAQRAVIKGQVEFIKGEAERKRILASINVELNDVMTSEERRIQLLKDRAKAERDIELANQKRLRAEKEALVLLNKDGTTDPQEAIKNRRRIAEIERDIDISTNNIAASRARALASIKELQIIIRRMRDDAFQAQGDALTEGGDEDDTTLISAFVPSNGAEILQRRIDALDMVAQAAREQQLQDNEDFLIRKQKRLDVAQSLEFKSTISAAHGIAQIIRSLDEDDLENKKRSRTIAAIIDTAAAIARVFFEIPYPASIPAAISIAANGIAQINTIQNAREGNQISPIAIAQLNAIETASPDFFRTNQFGAAQAVLVVEDLTTTTGRIAVTNDRAELGG